MIVRSRFYYYHISNRDVDRINLITTIHSALGNPPLQNSFSPNKAIEEFLPHLCAQEKRDISGECSGDGGYQSRVQRQGPMFPRDAEQLQELLSTMHRSELAWTTKQ